MKCADNSLRPPSLRSRNGFGRDNISAVTHATSRVDGLATGGRGCCLRVLSRYPNDGIIFCSGCNLFSEHTRWFNRDGNGQACSIPASLDAGSLVWFVYYGTREINDYSPLPSPFHCCDRFF